MVITNRINPIRKEKPRLKAITVITFKINKIHNAIHNLVLFLILSFMESIEINHLTSMYFMRLISVYRSENLM